MDSLRHSFFFFQRQARTALRMPTAFFLSSFHPFVWMVLFGSLFQATADLRGFGAGPYVQYLAPGIAIMSALFGATYSGLGMLGDIHSGLLDKFLVTPVPRIAIIAGPLLNTTLQTVLQAVIILLTAIVMGARPRGGPGGILLVFLAVALLGSTFAAISNSLALITRTQRTMIAVVNFVSLPLVFLSSMMMSRELMPRWIQTVASLNPVDWAVTVSRSSFSGRFGLEEFRSLAFLFAFAACAWMFAFRSLLRYQRSG